MQANTKTLGTLALALLLSIPTLLAQGHSTAVSDAPVDSKTKSEMVTELGKLLIDQYIFLDVARKTKDHLEQRLRNGDYEAITSSKEFAGILTEDLRSVSKDRHFFVGYDPRQAALIRASLGQSEADKRQAEAAIRERERGMNYGFHKLERLPGNVGYLEIGEFCNPENGGDTAVAAMNILAGMDAVIIDLRNSPGGQPNMVQLICSYFVKGTMEGRTLLNSFERRYNNSIEQYWTLSFVPGRRMYDTDLYVLTSGGTGSGAEEFAYNMKNLKRATIIGETTVGAAHPIDDRIILADFIMHLPTGRPVNPISRTNWEGTGVEPDIKVPADQALDVAHRMALQKILASAQEDRRFEMDWAMGILDARLSPLSPDPKELKKYAGRYGERTVSLEDGKLYYQRKGPRYRLIPIKPDLFIAEGLDYFRVRFKADADGRITELEGLYDDGTSDPSPRTR